MLSQWLKLPCAETDRILRSDGTMIVSRGECGSCGGAPEMCQSVDGATCAKDVVTGPTHGGCGKIERRERDNSNQHGTWSICARIINFCWFDRFEQRIKTSYANIFIFIFFFFPFSFSSFFSLWRIRSRVLLC